MLKQHLDARVAEIKAVKRKRLTAITLQPITRHIYKGAKSACFMSQRGFHFIHAQTTDCSLSLHADGFVCTRTTRVF